MLCMVAGRVEILGGAILRCIAIQNVGLLVLDLAVLRGKKATF